MKIIQKLLVAIAFTVILPGTGLAEDIGDIMKNAFKGDTSLFKKVTSNKGTKEDAEKLAAWCAKLKGTAPEKGEQAAWDKRVDALIEASKAAARGGAAGISALRNAGNCKNCHQAHRED